MDIQQSWPVFKTYLIFINNQMQKSEKLKKDEILFKAIKKEEICIKTEPKAFANLVGINSNSNLQKRAIKEKK